MRISAAAPRNARRGFTLLEILAAVGIFAILLVGCLYALQRMAANQREADAAREFRGETEACFNQLQADLETMPVRNDLEYRFNTPTLYPGGLEVGSLWVTGQAGSASLLSSASADFGQSAPALRAYSLAAYRVGAAAEDSSRWGGLQRGLCAFSLNDAFQGLQAPANPSPWPLPAEGVDSPALAALPSLPPEAVVRDWAPAALQSWPLEARHFTGLSRQIIAMGLAYQLRVDMAGPDGRAYHAGQILAMPPLRERPAGSGEQFLDVERLGALVIGLAWLPEDQITRLTLAELINLTEALDFPQTTDLTDTPVSYWERRAGPLAPQPHPEIPENIRRQLRFQQRLIRVGSMHPEP